LGSGQVIRALLSGCNFFFYCQWVDLLFLTGFFLQSFSQSLPLFWQMKAEAPLSTRRYAGIF
jgi:hypothetical protein